VLVLPLVPLTGSLEYMAKEIHLLIKCASRYFAQTLIAITCDMSTGKHGYFEFADGPTLNCFQPGGFRASTAFKRRDFDKITLYKIAERIPLGF